MSPDKLNILYYVENLGLGGANQTTITVAREMKARGHRIVFASDDGPLSRLLEEASITHVPVRTKVRHPSVQATRCLMRAIDRHGIDLICPNGFDCTLDAVPAGLLTGKPIVPTYGGLFTPPYPHPRLPRVNVFSQELATDLILRFGWHPGSCRNLIARIDGDRFHVGIDPDPFRRGLKIASQAPLIIMVCRQDARKLCGILVLLDAAAEVLDALPNARIVLLGDGDCRDEVLDRIGQIHDRVGREFILAPGSTTDTPTVFAAADVVVANGARSALEAMACGRAVVSVGPNGFDGVVSKQTIESFRRFNFDKGRLAGNPLGDHQNLVRALVCIVKDDTLRRELGEFSAAYALEHLIIHSGARDYEALYREAVADPWAGPWGRLSVASNWLNVVARFYGHRLRWRRIEKDKVTVADRLTSPPPGLDPEWRVGLDEGRSSEVASHLDRG